MVNVTKQVAQNSQYQQQQQAQAGYGKQQPHAQGYGARNQYGAAQPAAKAATGYSAQSNGYQQSQPAAPTPAYGRQNSFSSQTQASYPAQTQASYPGQQPAQQATYGQTQAGYSTQASYGAQQQQPAYGQPTQSGYGAQPVATGYQAAGYAGQQPAYGQPQQPGNFNRPQAGAGFAAAPVSTGGSSSYGAQSVGYGGASAPAVAQSPGVNSLAAATSLSSSRISTPSVDMSSQKKDGFVSSVGNKELTLKYGNATSAVLSPMAGQNTPKSFNNVVLGSTENVSQQDMPIVNAFNEVIAQLQTLPLAMVSRICVFVCVMFVVKVCLIDCIFFFSDGTKAIA
jgi:protein transport protein SEC31